MTTPAMTTASSPVPPQAPLAGGAEPAFPDTYRSEMTKIRTLRSAFWSFFAAVLVVLGLGILISAIAGSNNNGINGPDDFFQIITGSWALGQFAFMVLGIMAVTNEYATGLISNTLLATPQRWRVLLAKVAAFVTVTFVLAELISFINFFIGHAILSADHFVPNNGITGPSVLRGVIGCGLEATLVGLMGMGIGSILKNTAGSIVSGVAILLVLPGLAHILPTSVWHPILEYWPTEAGAQLLNLHKQSFSNGPALTAWWGSLDMTAFVVVLLVLGGWIMNRRDV